MQYENVVENLVLNETLVIEGDDWDNTLIRNVTIEGVNGNGITLRDVENVRIDSVTIRNVSGDGIKLSLRASTSNVIISNSEISNVGEDGINASQRSGVDHPGLQIIGNTIDSTGLNWEGSNLRHGLYIQSSEFIIRDNLIKNSTDGDGISVRSSGVIENNAIDGAYKSGIAYYADHDPGEIGRLEITNNVITDVAKGVERAGIDLLRIPYKSKLVDDILVSGNTVADNVDSAVDVSPDYDSVATDPIIEQNTLASSFSVGWDIFVGDYGASPDGGFNYPTNGSTPGGSGVPTLFAYGNMRLSLADTGSGGSTVLISHEDINFERNTIGAETKLRGTVIEEMGLSISAEVGNWSSRLGIDSGRLMVFSSCDDFESGVENKEALVFGLEDSYIGDVNRVILGLDESFTAATVRIELSYAGELIGEVERAADSVIDITFPQVFDEVRVSAGSEGTFALTWVEFGAPSADAMSSKTDSFDFYDAGYLDQQTQVSLPEVDGSPELTVPDEAAPQVPNADVFALLSDLPFYNFDFGELLV